MASPSYHPRCSGVNKARSTAGALKEICIDRATLVLPDDGFLEAGSPAVPVSVLLQFNRIVLFTCVPAATSSLPLFGGVNAIEAHVTQTALLPHSSLLLTQGWHAETQKCQIAALRAYSVYYFDQNSAIMA